ncbi:4-alpha-glucanotransferase [Brevibacterium sp. 5221]|uniref:4-alpha-glucanotransferase n=1 Tax=Brevibacterium rongguiense TaxID=2695267 RepID=A0A6N9HAM1_9MICO|nr:4-alpha-glucanotransferase [Brevibacterium rongguiense]MYM20846.1 4-alpha-glucanotransferase [Brevibacterium rongguiense]
MPASSPRPARPAIISETTSALRDLADAAGVLWEYEDSQSRRALVADEVLADVLAARGYPARTAEEIAESLRRLEAARWERALPPFVGAFIGEPAPEIPVVVDDRGTATLELVPEDGGAPIELAAGPAGPAHTVMRDGRAVLRREHRARLPRELAVGYHTLRLRSRTGDGAPEVIAESTLAVAPQRLPIPPGRQWGLTIQLYSVRSRASWGIGDFGDLGDIVAAAAQAGADFVLINPIHAGAPEAPVENSPYLPSSRQAIDPIYLRIEAIPEFASAGEPVVSAVVSLGRRWMSADIDNQPIERGGILDDKILALETLYDVPFTAARRSRFARFSEEAPAGMRAWAVYNAIIRSTEDGRIPAKLRDPDSEAVAEFARTHEREVGFWLWTQFLAAEQLADAARAAEVLGMRTGIVTDLAVGVSHSGADAWALEPYLAADATVGAPADYYNQQGQDWSQPPWDPDALAAAGYVPLRDLFRTAFTGAGGIRIDHVMGLFRLWWVPAGRVPAEGAYVRYDDRAILAVLLIEAQRAGVTVVGEDLGTVEPRVRERLAQLGIMGTSVMWFERDGDALADPAGYRRGSLATLNTHDMTPISGYLNLEDIDLSERLGVLVDDPQAIRRAEAEDRTAALRALAAQDPDGELAHDIEAGRIDEAWPVMRALVKRLARTDAALTGVALADIVGERRAQNKPGTSTEYPNWTLPLADDAGRPVLVDDLVAHRGLREIGQLLAAGLHERGERAADRARRPGDAAAGGGRASAGASEQAESGQANASGQAESSRAEAGRAESGGTESAAAAAAAASGAGGQSAGSHAAPGSAAVRDQAGAHKEH